MTSPDPGRPSSALLTDLYQLTMVTAYLELGMTRPAVFEFYARRMPRRRGFLLAAGLEQVLDFLAGLRFTPDELRWLGSIGRLPEPALARLEALRFTGDVDAMPEGTVFFADEPILRVTAPLPEAQLVESRIINLLHFQTMIASKAARVRIAAGQKWLADFGMRRAHGAEAALLAARACRLAGYDSTATVEAGRLFGIPLSGTMAHSFVQAHDDELQAFTDFARIHPRGLTLLIDTYDVLEGARKAIELQRQGVVVKGVRIDSGDLLGLSRAVRSLLDQGGCSGTWIVASGNLDEYRIADLLAAGAPIDSFGVGTNVDVSEDEPSLDCVYKIQEYAGRARRKRSSGKATWPGRKQVMRELDGQGRIARDVVMLAEPAAAGAGLLQPVMRGGRTVIPRPHLDGIRAYARRSIDTLPDACRRIHGPQALVAEIAPDVRALASDVDRATGA